MAHYAFLNNQNVVVRVISGRDENEIVADISDWEAYYAQVAGVPAEQVKRTSYNTFNGEHREGGTPFRGTYAGIGYTYNPALDEFVAPPDSEVVEAPAAEA